MGRRVSLVHLPHSTACFVCGSQNPVGLKHRFAVEDGVVISRVCIPDGYNGFKGIVHGGIASALLDETMGWAAYVHGRSMNLYFTRDLGVKFRRNAPVGVPLGIRTSFVTERRSLAEVKGELVDADGTVLVQARGTFAPVPETVMRETLDYLTVEEGVAYHEKLFATCSAYGIDRIPVGRGSHG